MESQLKEHQDLNVNTILKDIRNLVMATRNEILGGIGEKLVEIQLLKRNIKIFRVDFNNPYFDLIIDTTTIPPEEVVRQIMIYLNKKNVRVD